MGFRVKFIAAVALVVLATCGSSAAVNVGPKRSGNAGPTFSECKVAHGAANHCVKVYPSRSRGVYYVAIPCYGHSRGRCVIAVAMPSAAVPAEVPPAVVTKQESAPTSAKSDARESPAEAKEVNEALKESEEYETELEACGSEVELSE